MHKKVAHVCMRDMHKIAQGCIRRRGVGECIRDMHKKDAYVCIIDMHKVA